MLRTLRITSFRGLREFAMSGLGRVNLLVGTNNCGKTTVLEAIHVLAAPGTVLPLWQAQSRRGELVDSRPERQIDVAHLVHGHKLVAGAGFHLACSGTDGWQKLKASLVPRDALPKGIDDGDDGDTAAAPGLLELLCLQLEWRGGASTNEVQLPARIVEWPLTRRGGAILHTLGPRDTASASTVSFVTTDGLTRDSVTSMFDSVVLTPDEDTVLRALHTIDPAIERIASVGTHGRASSRDARGGIAMMVAGQRIPIGSMGDGIWRLLGVALALVRARGGVLLVDEIDTGLHYSVLVDMWRLVFEAARSLDVQVFATTHSRDCYEALAAVTEADRNEISLQRIERGKPDAVAFSEAEIRQAAERGLEVR
jgi:energy-coupling factor transporter ATP-binding protein EcfA2